MRIHPSFWSTQGAELHYSMYLDNTMLPKQDIEFGNEPHNSNSETTDSTNICKNF